MPNFGQDFDIKETNKNIAITEKRLGTTFTPHKPAKKAPPKDYAVPNFGMDKDILDAKASIDSTEKTLKYQWKPT